MYTDLSRAESINKENTEWMKNFDSQQLPEQATFLKSAFLKMYTEYYLIHFEQLKAENKLYELNRFADKLKFTQSAYYRIRTYDNKFLEKLASANTNEELFELLYEIRTKN